LDKYDHADVGSHYYVVIVLAGAAVAVAGADDDLGNDFTNCSLFTTPKMYAIVINNSYPLCVYPVYHLHLILKGVTWLW